MRLGPTLLAAACLLAAAASAAELPPAGCLRLLREARIAAEHGSEERELELLRRAAKECPEKILPALALVEYPDQTRLEEGELRDARAAILERLADPRALVPNSALRRMAGDSAASREDREALRRGIEARLAGAPADPDLLEALALVLAQLSDREAERSVLARLDAVRPSAATSWRRGRLAEDLGHRDEALECYRGVRARYGNSPAVAEKIGMLLVATGRLDEARREASELESDPVGRPAAGRLLLALAWALWDGGKDGEAKAAFREAARVAPDDGEAAEVLKTLFATPEERRALAVAEAERFERMREPNELFETGTSQLVAGDAAAAAGLLRRAVAASPGMEMGWFNLGVAAFRLQRWEEARAAFDRAAAINSARAETFLHLGEALLELGRLEESVAALGRALALRPDLPEAHASLSDCYRRMGKAAEAEREMKLARPSR